MSLTIMQVAGNRGMAGMERHVVNVSRELRARGLRVVIACKERSWISNEARGEFEVYTLPFRRRFDFASAARVSRLVEDIRPDIVHVHGPVAFRFAAKAVWSPLVVSAHGLSGWGSSLSRADVVVAVSHWTRAGIERLVKEQSRIRVVHNGIDCSRFAGFSDTGRTFREEFGLDGRLVITCVSRLVPAKGQHVLLEAAKTVLERFPEVRFVVVGSRSESYERSLRRICSERQIEDTVVFTGERHDIPQILAATDILVQPSLEESLGISVIEGMAASLPVVASRVGGLPELVEHGVTGLLVEPGNPAELADALIELIDDPDARNRMGRAGRERACGHFSIDVMIDKFVSIYRDAAGARADLEVVDC
ncbi:MAG: glycosyltransferase family 4 protein [Armatimonadetes bacterium]|nr:glycosyltransferase family 4 protein [Armatimonadota bacterium]